MRAQFRQQEAVVSVLKLIGTRRRNASPWFETHRHSRLEGINTGMRGDYAQWTEEEQNGFKVKCVGSALEDARKRIMVRPTMF